VAAWVDGAMPFRAETIRGYLQGMHQLYLTDPAVKTIVPAAAPPADIEIRYKYNQDVESIYAMVPSSISLLLALFPAILMALAIVREKELGSITNLYVTPVTRLEFLVGKQLSYIGVAMANFAVIFLMALFPVRRAAQRQLSNLNRGRIDLCRDDYGLWDGHLGLHEYTDCGAVRYRDSDSAAGNPVRRDDDAGLLALGNGSDHWARVSNELFRANQRRHLYQAAWVCRPHREFGGAFNLHSGPDGVEPLAPAQAGTLGAS
jgi:hypothetical protein